VIFLKKNNQSVREFQAARLLRMKGMQGRRLDLFPIGRLGGRSRSECPQGR
jgi:hypothetical protein